MEYQKIAEAIPHTTRFDTELKTINGVQYSVRRRQSRAVMIRRNGLTVPGFFIEVNYIPVGEKEADKTDYLWLINGEQEPVLAKDEWSGERSSADLFAEVSKAVDVRKFASSISKENA